MNEVKETKKYELTDETITLKTGEVLHRIKALRDIYDVNNNIIAKAGSLGGFIEKEDNLSHTGSCWVADEAKVFGDAMVCDNARIHGKAEVYGNAMVYGNAKMYGHAVINDNIKLYGETKVITSIKSNEDCYTTGPIGSRKDCTTFQKSNENGEIYVATGCFKGTLNEFTEAVKKEHRDNEYAKEYFKAIKEAKEYFGIM